MSSAARTVHVPVRVTRSRPRSEATPAQPVVQAPPTLKAKPPLHRRSIHSLPIEQRRRMMWFVVAGGMLLVLFGWAMTLGHELQHSSREPSLLQQIGDLFRINQPAPKTASPQEEEIRELEGQVFPQF